MAGPPVNRPLDPLRVAFGASRPGSEGPARLLDEAILPVVEASGFVQPAYLAGAPEVTGAGIVYAVWAWGGRRTGRDYPTRAPQQLSDLVLHYECDGNTDLFFASSISSGGGFTQQFDGTSVPRPVVTVETGTVIGPSLTARNLTRLPPVAAPVSIPLGLVTNTATQPLVGLVAAGAGQVIRAALSFRSVEI